MAQLRVKKKNFKKSTNILMHQDLVEMMSHSISTPTKLSPVESQGKSPRASIIRSNISVIPDQNDNPGTSGTQAFHLEYIFCDETCGDCQERCIYTRQQLESDNIGQKQIRDELYRHSHPKTRNIVKGTKKRLLTTTEQKDELLNHYTLRHNLNEINENFQII